MSMSMKRMAVEISLGNGKSYPSWNDEIIDAVLVYLSPTPDVTQAQRWEAVKTICLFLEEVGDANTTPHSCAEGTIAYARLEIETVGTVSYGWCSKLGKFGLVGVRWLDDTHMERVEVAVDRRREVYKNGTIPALNYMNVPGAGQYVPNSSFVEF